MRLLLPAIAAIALTAAAAISMARSHDVAAGAIVVKEAWARATPPGTPVGAAYVTVRNDGPDERLIGAESPAAQAVQMHETTMKGDVISMRAVARAVIPAGGTLEMRPGGTHLMLTGLAAPLKQGDTIPLTLVFENAGPVTLRLEVAPIGAGPPPGHQH